MITYAEQLQDMAKSDLYELAKEANVTGRSKMTKAALIEALVAAQDDVLATQEPEVREYYEDAEIIRLAKQGITEATHNVKRVAEIIREWFAQGVDVFAWGEVMDFILFRNTVQAGDAIPF